MHIYEWRACVFSSGSGSLALPHSIVRVRVRVRVI
jgi:hypothetical protein